ncbi:hypothetical protein CTAYLR_006949 [Chrysophaeum taylorii]|uniref:Uncharacterized protein n=1 Tax=Chrysophaeum taylorii TaxID=2483200 RepID=A0AAD7XLU0_9STRA|nr:hypothetical protein CTAYLR_006949 [Chrysophaeum taylorii]
MKVLFLDIDGVLVPFGGLTVADPAAPFDDECVRRLARIISRTGAKIVLSSTWRSSATAKEMLRNCFRSFGLPDFEETGGDHSLRQWEIAAWLREHEPERWVALDDEELVAGPENRRHSADFRDHAILIDSKTGLQDEHVTQAIVILNG